MEKVIVCSSMAYNFEGFRKLRKGDRKRRYFLFKSKRELNLSAVKRIKPRYVFVLHWHWSIPEKIVSEFECIVFHMTDLPFGRGGSPLQNLLVRGIYKTKLTAFRVNSGFDAGAIYLKQPIDISSGSCRQIFEKISVIAFEMVERILQNKITPVEQIGKIVVFKRRMPCESELKGVLDLRQTYDFIRMLDGEGYPKAFVNTKKLLIEFSEAEFGKNCVKAKATFWRR